jgi:hypothetical protein
MNRILGTSLLALALAVDAGCRTPQESTGAPAPPPLTIRCGVALDLHAASGLRRDWGGVRAWTAEAKDDTLRLTRKGPCGDECSYEEEILLAPVSASCPAYVAARVVRTEAGSPMGRIRQVRDSGEGSVEIQDWNPSGGIVSGRLKAEFDLTFYVEIPRAPEE